MIGVSCGAPPGALPPMTISLVNASSIVLTGWFFIARQTRVSWLALPMKLNAVGR